MLTFKGMSSVSTSLTLKYNKTLKALPLHLYESIQLLVNVCDKSGSSALSITYSMLINTASSISTPVQYYLNTNGGDLHP